MRPSIRLAVLLALSSMLGCSGDGGSPDASGGVDGAVASGDAGATGDGSVPLRDGSGRDAAMPDDGGGSDGGGTAEGCEGSTALFCEDFEALSAGTASSARWNTETGGGALTIDADHARGAQALHVHTDGNGHAFLRLDFVPPGNSYFGRMFIYVTEFPSAPAWAHYTLVEQRGEGAGLIRPVGGQYVPTDDAAFWGIGSDGGPTGDWTNWRTSAPSEAGRWVCVEWEMDDADNFIRLRFDGVDNDDLTVDTTHHGGNAVDFVFPRFDSIRIGWQLYQGGPTPSMFDLWIDDIVLDTSSVGC